MRKYKNIYGSSIRVSGKIRLVGEVFDVEMVTAEIKNLVRCRYIEEVN